MSYISDLGKRSKAAERTLAAASTALKNHALSLIADELINNSDDIIAANNLDLEAAVKNNMSVAMQDRLKLTAERIDGIASAVRELIALDDPVGKIIDGGTRPSGLKIVKMRVPLGKIGIIYESRPNVTVDAATLCLKAGNTVILRGGSEAINSNIALVRIMRTAIEKAGLPADAVILVENTSRDIATELMRANGYLDVLIPRGGAGLIRSVMENATVPVIETGVGNCHAYADADCDLEMAVSIIYNAKTSRPSVCNAIENLLVHKDIASTLLPAVKASLDKNNVEIRGCERTREILKDANPATNEDYATEYNDFIIAVKVVDSLDEAIEHINHYGSGHSETIITNSLNSAERFQREVDAAAVYVNASTRFTDGGVFGLGAEIGISTQKLHARGPMGLNELTSVKYLINGNGQIR